ncbi:MAG: ribbon-helix-helix protein, CopG family [Anaerolineae bacterium]|jgi:Arc/MetJ-type ribon-helix-helix transcriptional regulator|nr:ribbon-helix-helix protein, CopG family [Anaerolineae bacterium]
MDRNRSGRQPLLVQPRQITTLVEQGVYEQLVHLSRKKRLSMSELIRRAIDELLQKQAVDRS